MPSTCRSRASPRELDETVVSGPRVVATGSPGRASAGGGLDATSKSLSLLNFNRLSAADFFYYGPIAVRDE